MAAGETDLKLLLASLAPRLDPAPYVMVTAAGPVPEDVEPLATFAEDEGLTLIVGADRWFRTDLPVSPRLARLVMTVHSSLEAVGMTAAIAAALTGRGISANVVAAFHHDHIFVPWDRREDALAAIEALAASAR